MSSSPYIAKQIKDYMRKFTIQETINTSVNDLLKNLPEDPYSYLIGLFQKKCSPDIQILEISMNQVISGEGFPVISLRVKINYLNQEMQFNIQQPYGISSDDNNIFDSQGKGMKLGITFYNDKIRTILKNKKFKTSEQQQIDSQLVKVYSANQKKGLYQINCISFSIQSIKSRIFCQPLYRIYSQLAQRQIKNTDFPKLYINCLHGGKAIGSKCKVYKYYLISCSKEGLPLIPGVLQNIKKTITSGKGGQAALKYSPDGTFICPLDTILDNLKIVQDAINNTAGAKQHFKIGLSWQADTLFGVDTKKYQLQNPKTPFDNDQMIDYLVKLVTDKPVISYLEDPLASSEISSWAKLIKKCRQTEALKNIKIGARNGNLLNAFSQTFKQKHQQLSIPFTSDSHPQLSPQQLHTKNSLKFTLNTFQIRLSQLQTVSHLLKLHKQLQKTSTQLILQDNQYETYNNQIVDISLGLGVGCNLGSIVKYDRLCKVYRAIEVVKEMEGV